MGLFDKIKDAQSQAAGAMQDAGGMSGMGGGGIGGMGTEAAGYVQLAQKLHASGVEAPGVLHTITPTGNTDMGGGQETKFDVSIKPADGEPYQTAITQAMLPAQLEGLSEGAAITVKYDPDNPTSALIYGW